jgi:hypothetical protein
MRRDTIILRLLLVTFATFMAAAGFAGAQAEDPEAGDIGGYPPEIQRTLQRAIAECKNEGGEGVTFAPGTVEVLGHVNGGRSGYIVNLNQAECKGRDGVYCASSGCELAILVELGGGRMRTVFTDRVRGYEILPGRGARTIRFELHGAYCGGHGVPSCFKSHRITARPFGFKLPP